jgi:hypothetical protein
VKLLALVSPGKGALACLIRFSAAVKPGHAGAAELQKRLQLAFGAMADYTGIA